MYCVGLTGTIASGKSTVAELFHAKGIVVISADEAARTLTKKNQPAVAAIAKHFGDSVLHSSGELNRPALRKIIFNEPDQRLWLEGVLHPLIRNYIKVKIKEASGPYVLIEIPLLYNRSDFPYLDRILVIRTNLKIAVERVMKRDQSTKKQTQAILAVQTTNGSHFRYGDDVIKNNGTLEELKNKIENLHQQYLQLASQKS